MKLDYGTQISPFPIVLSVGTLIKPTLKKIADSNGIGFDKFNYYEVFLKMTPEIFFINIKEEEGIEYWDSLSDEEKKSMSLYDIIINDEQLINIYLEIFNFFFAEPVIFREGYFVLLNKDKDIDVEQYNTMSEEELLENIRGIISNKTFSDIIYVLQQVCCIDDEIKEEKPVEFKNDIAKKLYEKIKKSEQKRKEMKKVDLNYTIPNLISAVSNKHPSLNPINIWDLTIFQLKDSFNRMMINSIYDIDCTRVSVWGDEKNKFDATLWYKNEFDKL